MKDELTEYLRSLGLQLGDSEVAEVRRICERDERRRRNDEIETASAGRLLYLRSVALQHFLRLDEALWFAVKNGKIKVQE
jgi:hypothetical protein